MRLCRVLRHWPNRFRGGIRAVGTRKEDTISVSETARSGTELDIEYSRPRAGDLDAVLALLSRDFGPHYRMSADDENAVRIMRAYADGEYKSGIIARAGDQLAGFILYDLTDIFAPTGRHARTDYAAVDPAFRKRGIMAQLLHRAWEQAAREGACLFLHKSSVPIMVDFLRRLPQSEERGVYFFVHLTEHDTEGDGDGRKPAR